MCKEARWIVKNWEEKKRYVFTYSDIAFGVQIEAMILDTDLLYASN